MARRRTYRRNPSIPWWAIAVGGAVLWWWLRRRNAVAPRPRMDPNAMLTATGQVTYVLKKHPTTGAPMCVVATTGDRAALENCR